MGISEFVGCGGAPEAKELGPFGRSSCPPSLTDKKYLYSGTCVFASIRRGRKVPNQVPRVPSLLAGACLLSAKGEKKMLPRTKAVCLT